MARAKPGDPIYDRHENRILAVWNDHAACGSDHYEFKTVSHILDPSKPKTYLRLVGTLGNHTIWRLTGTTDFQDLCEAGPIFKILQKPEFETKLEAIEMLKRERAIWAVDDPRIGIVNAYLSALTRKYEKEIEWRDSSPF